MQLFKVTCIIPSGSPSARKFDTSQDFYPFLTSFQASEGKREANESAGHARRGKVRVGRSVARFALAFARLKNAKN